MFVVTIVFEKFGKNVNKIFWDGYSLLMKKSVGFIGGLGGQMTLTLKDQYKGAIDSNIPCCTKPFSKVALSTENSQTDNEQDNYVGI